MGLIAVFSAGHAGILAVAKGLVVLGASPVQEEALGFAPRALIMWWSRQDELGHRWGNQGGVGVVARNAQAAVSWASAHSADPPRSRHWTRDCAILGFTGPSKDSPAVQATVHLADAGFAIETERTDVTWLVHYLAFGGDELRDAAVARLAVDANGPQPVRGLGFQPDCVFLAAACPDPGGSAPGVMASIGCTTARAEAASGYASLDGAAHSHVSSWQGLDRVIAIPSAESHELAGHASLTSMDRDGFTLDWSSRTARVGALALALRKGRYALGSGTSPTGRRKKQLAQVGFKPTGLLAFSSGLPRSPEARSTGRLSVGAGAASPFAVGGVCWADANNAARPSKTQVRTSETALLEIADSHTDALHARAELERFTPDGFVLDWTIADRQRREFAYLAVGSSRVPQRRGDHGVVRR